MKSRKKKPFAIGIWKISVLSLLCAMIAGAFSYHQMDTYEESVIEIYATQQDTFVQIVLDQMNRLDSGKEEKAIVTFIETLDASANRYWTLSKENSLIFVKDENDTNRYKGLTTATYYMSDSAKEFIQGLTMNKIIHRFIEINKRSFLASGVIFEYEGIQYQLCLLMNPDAVLDHNAYLQAKTHLSAMIVVILMIFVLFLILLTSYNVKKQKELDEKEQECLALRKTIQRINEEYTQQQLYDTRQNLFLPEVLPMLLEKLEKRKIQPITFVTVKADNKEAFQTFLRDCQLVLDQSVFRFSKGELQILLIFLQCTKDIATNMVKSLEREEVHFVEWKEVKDIRHQSLIKLFEKKGDKEEYNGE